MLDPQHDPMPTEEELARIAGLVPGEVDQKKLEELRQSLNEKGFMVTKAEDLFTWARTGSLWWITSTAQQARPKVIHHKEPVRAQVNRSSVVVTMKPFSFSD